MANASSKYRYWPDPSTQRESTDAGFRTITAHCGRSAACGRRAALRAACVQIISRAMQASARLSCCVLTDELLRAKDDLLSEGGQFYIC